MPAADAAALRGAALVTGASAGIGYAIAREFAAHGHDLFLIGRHAARLEATATDLADAFSVSIHTLAIDVTAPHACAEIENALAASRLDLGYVINNAGAWLGGRLQDSPPDELERLLATNVTAVHRLTRALLPTLLARGKGAILNVGSMAGMLPMPSFALYGASKTFLHAMTAALRQELRGSGISVSLLAPGMVRTEFVTRKSGTQLPAWLDVARSSPETVARAAYRGLMSDTAVIVPGLIWRFSHFGVRILPTTWITSLLGAAIRYLTWNADPQHGLGGATKRAPIATVDNDRIRHGTEPAAL